MTKELRRIRNALITDCFKDPADCDYIAARAAWRLGLTDQFLWSAQQAIEKYLKAILLYHDKNTKRLGHDLEKALSCVESIRLVPWGFDDGLRRLCRVLTTYGADRYFTVPRLTYGPEPFVLDASVWRIRRFCQDLLWLDDPVLAKGLPPLRDYIKELTDPDCEANAVAFRPMINKGHLEAVLDSRKYLDQRQMLVWKNRYFGSRRKGRIRATMQLRFSRPIHFMRPEIFQWAESRIQFSKDIVDHFCQLRTSGTGT